MPRQGPRAAATAAAAVQLDRRTAVLSLLATQLLWSGRPARAAGLTKSLQSKEGFEFLFPEDYVVAFDRSGGSGTGAVAVVGNFKTYDTISVFRTELPPSTLSAGRLAGGARAYEELCLSPFINEGGTMRFNLLSSELRDPAGVYDFEFQLESCRGTVQEGVGGRILCLGPAGQDLVTLRRHHVGRCFLIGGYAYQIMASAPEDRWPAIEPTLRAVVDSFRVI